MLTCPTSAHNRIRLSTEPSAELPTTDFAELGIVPLELALSRAEHGIARRLMTKYRYAFAMKPAGRNMREAVSARV